MESSTSTEAAPSGAGECVVSELVVLCAFVGVAQDFISLRDFLELILCGLIPRVLVGVVFDGEFAIGFFDFVGAGFALDAEQFIVVVGHNANLSLLQL